MAAKKVLHLIQSLDSGGCEHMLLRTLPLLSKLDHAVLTLKEVGELAPRFLEKNISVTSVNQKNLFDIPSYTRLQKMVRSIDPDVIITYLFHADFVGRIFLSKYPVVPFLRTTYNDSQYLLPRCFEQLSRFLVSRYLANSEAVKKAYVSRFGIPEDRIIVIPNGIDTAVFESSHKMNLEERLGLAPQTPLLISVANFHPNKGHSVLIQAFHSLTTRFPQLALLLVGDGEERKRLERQVYSLQLEKNVFFLGKRGDIPELLHASDIFVLATRFEGLSNALLEAMAARLPVITTDIPENREIIESDKNGILVPVNDARALEYAIEKLLREPRKRATLGENAYRTVEEHFSLAHSAQAFGDFLMHQTYE